MRVEAHAQTQLEAVLAARAVVRCFAVPLCLPAADTAGMLRRLDLLPGPVAVPPLCSADAMRRLLCTVHEYKPSEEADEDEESPAAVWKSAARNLLEYFTDDVYLVADASAGGRPAAEASPELLQQLVLLASGVGVRGSSTPLAAGPAAAEACLGGDEEAMLQHALLLSMSPRSVDWLWLPSRASRVSMLRALLKPLPPLTP